ncbi:MAG: methylated-DNA--[protein]-cysteine S-methyltransferase [Desulfobulbaceae bacterium]|nr:methylated-DNA--[protein]-cysteine S-methyltransferase [Desulfobulbaceae bacterium]
MKMNKENMQSATFMTAIGPVTIEADAQGLTAISLSGRHRRTMKEDRVPDNPLLQEAARQVREYLQGKRTDFDLPLTIYGTDFQKKVWELIREIPYGKTRSYGDIARQLGSAAKSRAVGGAAHANSLLLVIPCHRVIGTNGSLTGFGSGLELKKKLLELEKKSR